MERMLVEELDSDINAARDKLRHIDEKVTTLNGRVPRVRISYNEEPDDAPLRNIERKAFGLADEETSAWKTRNESTQSAAPIRRRITIEDRVDRRGSRQSFDHLPKRQRPDYLDDEGEDDDYGKRPKKTMQSTVVMPALDSKGREEKIEKLKESENKDSKQRNRRLFSSLLMGTLSSFKKTDKKTAQQEKQEEVEKRLEETKKKEIDARREEKNELLTKRREHERELHGLQRKKALIQYADRRITQLKCMKGAIKTMTTPHIYWQPMKHTVRSLELKQATERQLDDLIKEREEQLKIELEERKRENSEGEEQNGEVKEEDGDGDGEDEYDEEKNENDEIVVVLKTENDLKREEEEEVEREDEIDVHVELD